MPVRTVPVVCVNAAGVRHVCPSLNSASKYVCECEVAAGRPDVQPSGNVISRVLRTGAEYNGWRFESPVPVANAETNASVVAAHAPAGPTVAPAGPTVAPPVPRAPAPSSAPPFDPTPFLVDMFGPEIAHAFMSKAVYMSRDDMNKMFADAENQQSSCDAGIDVDGTLELRMETERIKAERVRVRTEWEAEREKMRVEAEREREKGRAEREKLVQQIIQQDPSLAPQLLSFLRSYS